MQKPPIPPAPPGPGYERITNALEQILASEKFLSAPQMSAFLRYVVVQTVTGNESRIKAYTVAVDALGKPETFDPQNDPVVRVLAGRLRSTLSSFYEQHPDADVTIDMKPGSYVPHFILKEIRDPLADNRQKPLDSSAVKNSSIGDSFSGSPSVDMANAANNQWESTDDSHPHSADRSARLAAPPHATRADISARLAQDNSRSPGNTLTTLWARLGPLRKLGTVTSLACALLIGIYIGGNGNRSEPALLAGQPLYEREPSAGNVRPRSGTLSLFVSALAPAESLASQINAMISNTFSESKNIRVYRMLRSTQSQQFWPEDYIVSLNLLPLTDETQFSIQLVDAQTGRIAHSETHRLSAKAPEALSSEDLKILTDLAQRIISDNGPLILDYASKIKN